MDNLHSAILHPKRAWTVDEIHAGFVRFYELNDRYPTAHEIDGFEFLPSSRSLQRSFGGLVDVRRKLGLELENYTKGEYRAGKAREADIRARVYECEFYNFLKNHFKEIAIHEHKVIRPGDINCDFYVYLTADSGVVIDLFYAQDIRTLTSVVSIKAKRYQSLSEQTYFVVVGNPNITQEVVEAKMRNRKIPLSSHIFVVTEEHFKEQIIPALKKRISVVS